VPAWATKRKRGTDGGFRFDGFGRKLDLLSVG
jgi:hypothetical protein